MIKGGCFYPHDAWIEPIQGRANVAGGVCRIEQEPPWGMHRADDENRACDPLRRCLPAAGHRGRSPSENHQCKAGEEPMHRKPTGSSVAPHSGAYTRVKLARDSASNEMNPAERVGHKLRALYPTKGVGALAVADGSMRSIIRPVAALVNFTGLAAHINRVQQSSAHRLLHERADLCLLGGGPCGPSWTFPHPRATPWPGARAASARQTN